jgi:DNA-binding XRE family transcriptional regulator
LVRLGVAGDPRKRLRELQVGSPVKLELALAHPSPSRLDAEAVVAALERQFADRRAQGSWYRISAADVRSALQNPATVAAPATAAAAGAAAAADQARFVRRRGRSSRARTEKELAYQRRRRRERQAKQKRAARLIGRGRTQTDAAAAVGVSPRTLNNWEKTPNFRRELERKRERASPNSRRLS